MRRILNVAYFTYLFVLLTSAGQSYAAGANVCSHCKDDKQYCGQFDTPNNRWLSGKWYSCVLKDEMLNTPDHTITACSFCSSSGYASCGTFNTQTRRFANYTNYRCYNNHTPSPQFQTIPYQGDTHIAPSRPSRPYYPGNGGGYYDNGNYYQPSTPSNPNNSWFDPVRNNPAYDENRSAFNPDGSRDLGREMRNDTLYGTPYDRNNLNEQMSWCTLYGTIGQNGC